MNIKVVIGANYGDEGKGLMTSYFAREASKNGGRVINVLTNGGAQRGHTVDRNDGDYHIFHHFGSGTYCGVTSYFPNEFILNPMQFVKEDEELAGFPHKAFREGNNMWTTPYDMIFNQLDALWNHKHNTCGMGIWATICRSNSGLVRNLTIDDFCRLTYKDQVQWLDTVKTYYHVTHGDILSKRNRPISEELMAAWDSPHLADHFISDCIRFAKNVSRLPFRFLDTYDTVIFENAQGLLLDGDIEGEEEYNTPSTTGFKAVAKRLGSDYRLMNRFDGDGEVCYVSRTYLTWHGDGLFRGYNGVIHKSKWENNIYNTFQGNFKMTKILDYDKVISRIDDDFKLGLDYIHPKNRERFRRTIAFTHENELHLPTTLTGYNYISRSPVDVERIV